MSTRNALKTATREAWLSEYCRPYNAHLDRELAAGRLTLAQVEQGRAAKRADGLRRWRKLRPLHLRPDIARKLTEGNL